MDELFYSAIQLHDFLHLLFSVRLGLTTYSYFGWRRLATSSFTSRTLHDHGTATGRVPSRFQPWPGAAPTRLAATDLHRLYAANTAARPLVLAVSDLRQTQDMADAFDPSPRRTRSRSRFASDNSGHPRRRTRSRTVSRLSLHDTQPDPDVHILKAISAQETPTFVEKRPRHKMSDYQLQRLEELYRADTHPSRGAKEALAAEVGM